jgi:hypothetical protein
MRIPNCFYESVVLFCEGMGGLGLGNLDLGLGIWDLGLGIWDWGMGI